MVRKWRHLGHVVRKTQVLVCVKGHLPKGRKCFLHVLCTAAVVGALVRAAVPRGRCLYFMNIFISCWIRQLTQGADVDSPLL